jgi:adenine-specific DNA-methyltransferase
VDIDPQAVEVTKLSLLLKVIEDPGQLSLLDERILPDLGKNIQCGNSLIGPDYWDGQLMVAEREEERARVNAFDWKAAFPEVFAQGGFDVVVGNPPYIHSRSDQFDEYEKSYYFRSYKVAEYQINTFAMFLEKGFTLLRPNGLLGVIIPNYWLSTQFDKKLRNFLFFENSIREILNVYSVFADATVDTLIIVGEHANKDSYPKKVNIKSISRDLKTISQRLNAIREAQWEYSEVKAIERDSTDVSISFSKEINLQGDSMLGDYLEMRFGMKPYQVGKGNPPQTQKIVDEKGFDAKKQIDKNYFPLLKARNVKRYRMNWQGDWIKYGVHLAEPRTSSLFDGERILIQRIVSGQCLDGAFTSEKFICNTDVITLKPKEELGGFHLYFFLGVLLSRAIGFYLKSQNINLDRATFPKINTKTLNTLPLPSLDFSDPAEKAQHDKMVSLVERMLALQKSLKSTVNPQEADRLAREVESTDRGIDSLVYELYGLSEEEIKIVEGNIKT